MTLRDALIVGALVLAITGPASADQKVIQLTTIENPQMQAMLKQMSPDERAEAAKSGLGQPV